MTPEKTINEMSQDEQTLREEVFAEVFDAEVFDMDADASERIDEINNDDIASNETNAPQEQDAKNTDNAESPNIPSELQKQFEEISRRLETLSAVEERLKQTERRIGSIQNEFHAAKVAATEQSKAPTASEMATAAKDKADWDELKEDYPEWAEAIEKKLAATSAEVSKAIPKVSDLRDGLVSQDVFEERLLTFKHPDWKNTVKTAEYQDWLKAQPEDVQYKHYHGKTADDAIFVLDSFNAPRTTKKDPQHLAEERKNRLKQAEQKMKPQRTKGFQKSEDDMSEDELRELEFAKIWG